MSTLVEKEITENVVRQLKNCGNERLKEVSESLIRHLHAFISEVELAPDEWFFAINFLPKTGQICDETRQ